MEISKQAVAWLGLAVTIAGGGLWQILEVRQHLAAMNARQDALESRQQRISERLERIADLAARQDAMEARQQRMAERFDKLADRE